MCSGPVVDFTVRLLQILAREKPFESMQKPESAEEKVQALLRQRCLTRCKNLPVPPVSIRFTDR